MSWPDLTGLAAGQEAQPGRQNVPAGGREPGGTIKNVNQGPHPELKGGHRL